jgi:hypothetical protein
MFAAIAPLRRALRQASVALGGAEDGVFALKAESGSADDAQASSA